MTGRVPTDDPEFSLVFLTWNAAEDIERTISSVLEQTHSDFEIIVVDNDSDDRTVPIVRDAFLDEHAVRLIENEENRGFSRGFNRGIEAARGDYICCFNDDTRFPESYLQTLHEMTTPATVWTTARVNHRVSSEHRTVRLLSWYRFPIPYVVDRLTGVADVNYVPGDGLIVPRGVYENELDGVVFDPELPMRGEDVDLSLRLRRQGVPMRAVLDTYSIHPDEGIYSPTIENAWKHVENVFTRYLAYRNNGFGPLVLSSVLVSLIVVPTDIYFGSFPRDTAAFQRRVTVRRG